MENNNLHAGHRQRLANRFLKSGADDFELHNILELLLFGAVPRRDTNEIAHELIKKFGFCGVFEASPEELQSVDGIGPVAAAQIKLVLEIAKIYNQEKNNDTKIITSIEGAADYMRPTFIGRDYEIITLMCLDAKASILGYSIVTKGNTNTVTLDVRKIVEIALNYNAAGVLIAHNHPISTALPSPDDITSTQRLYSTLLDLGIKLLDHFIFTPDGEFISLSQSKMLKG